MDYIEMEYRILEQYYIENMQRNPKYQSFSELDCMRILFPNNWFHCKGYQKKIDILKQAIQKNTIVTEIPESLDFEEGIHRTR